MPSSLNSFNIRKIFSLAVPTRLAKSSLDKLISTDIPGVKFSLYFSRIKTNCMANLSLTLRWAKSATLLARTKNSWLNFFNNRCDNTFDFPNTFRKSSLGIKAIWLSSNTAAESGYVLQQELHDIPLSHLY